ncbi:MAG: EamA/RhaT family transporter [Rhizobacter sp.]|nr:EamA/RhaT family transporter [Rhizobacter sp.]
MPMVFVLIWSTGFVVARFGLPFAPPMKFLAWRFMFSLLGFSLWAFVAKAAWPRTRRQWIDLAIVGALTQLGYLAGVWSAVKLGLGAGTAALVVSLQPVLTAIWMSATSTRAGAMRAGAIARGESAAAGSVEGSAAAVSGRQWLGLGLGLAGLLIVVWHKLGLGEVTAASLGLCVFALISITVGTLYQKRHVVAGDPRTGNAIQAGTAFLLALPFAALETEPIVLDPHFIAALAWAVIVLTLGGGSLMYMLIQRGAATSFTSLLYLVPPCTAIMAWAMFGESLGLNTLVGLALTAAGVWLVMRSPVSATTRL